MSLNPRVILLSDLSRGFGRGIMKGIARYSNINGRWTFYHRPPSYLSSTKQLDLDELKRWQPNGIICSYQQSKTLRKLNVPFVCYDPGNYSGTLPCIVSEDDEIGRLAAQHLIDQGHKNFAFYGFGNLRWSKIRKSNYCKGIRSIGSTVSLLPEKMEELPWSREERPIQEWIRSLPKPVGLFCANDDRAAIVSELCIAMGFSIPDDISIIGADNDEILCEINSPPLSSVRISSEPAGFEAAELLSRLINKQETANGQRIVAKAVGIYTRQSTEILMASNEALRKAVQYIREKIHEQIRVTEVVRASGICHRSLNDLFQYELNTSIGKYLTNARIEHISNLLIDTNMQVQEIAAAVGYEDDRHFARYFKRTTGLSPQAYRKQLLSP